MVPTVVAVALRSQDEATGAVELHAFVQAAKQSMLKRMAKLAELRRWCTITTLISTELTKEDVIRLWKVLRRSPLGRAFPQAVSAMPNLLLRSSLKGVPLIAAPVPEYPEADLVGLKSFCVSPRCQCSSATVPPRADPRPENRGCRVGATVEIVTGNYELIHVPEWVAQSPYSWELGAPSCLLDVRPRFHCVDIEALATHPLGGRPGLFCARLAQITLP